MSESTLGGSPARSEDDRAGLELQHLQVQVEKLRLEVEGLRAQTFWDRTVGRYLPMVTALLAVAGFWVGLVQYNQERIGSDQRRTDELRRESARPFWDAQLKLYLRAAEAAAGRVRALPPRPRPEPRADRVATTVPGSGPCDAENRVAGLPSRSPAVDWCEDQVRGRLASQRS